MLCSYRIGKLLTRHYNSTFTRLRLNLMVYIDLAGNVVLGRAFDSQHGELVDLPSDLHDHLVPGSPLLGHNDPESKVEGLLVLKESMLLVSSRPILKSDDSGPIRGTLIMGRNVDADEVHLLSATTHMFIASGRIGAGDMPPDMARASRSLSARQPTLVRPLDSHTVAGYVLLNDVYGKPALILGLEEPRLLYEQGLRSLNYFMLSIALVALIFAAIIVLLFEWLVLSRLRRFAIHLRRVGAGGDLSGRVPVEGRDELASVAGTVNETLSALEKAQMERAFTEEERKKYARQLEALDQVGKTGTSSDVETVSRLSLQAALKALDLDAGSIRYVDESTCDLVLLVHSGLSAETSAESGLLQRFRLGQGLPGRVAQSGEVLVVRQIPDDVRAFLPGELRLKARYCVGIPLKVENRVVGVMMGFSVKERAEGHDESAIMTSLGNMIGMSLTNALLFQLVETGKREWEQTFDSMGDGVAILGLDCNIVRANWAFAHLVGSSPRELIGRKCQEVVHGSSSPHEDCPWIKCVKGKKACDVVRQEPFLGNRWMSQTAAPVLGRNGEVGSVVFTMKDVSESVSLSQAKSQFLSAVSHDLRTPLVSLRISVDLLRSRTEVPMADEARSRLLENMARNALRLERLASDVTDVAALESAGVRLDKEWVDPGSVLAAAAAEFSPLTQTKSQKIEVRVEPDVPLVLADRHRLEQVLANLLSNANKFSPKGTSIMLRASRRDKDVLFEVSDNGPGIPDDEQAKVFDLYHRGSKETSRRASGSGIGLNIVKQMVELHEGRIWIKSKVGQGSSFLFTLPLEVSNEGTSH